MKNMENIVEQFGFKYNENAIVSDFRESLKDKMFKKIVDKLDIEEKELIKRTSILKECSEELSNCQNCSSLFECKNKIKGYCYKPMIIDHMINFNYMACDYKKNMDENSKYLDNIYLFNVPKEIKEAKFSEIIIKEQNRVPVIKWLKEFIINYEKGKKGLYLNGNFGCGKTYMVSATLNELAKKNIKCAIIYWPEFLRDLKSSFSNGTSYNGKYEYIKNIEVLLIDDIGAEDVTNWGRDEILGTILQYRMQEKKTTFFTSNFTLNELEVHFSNTKGKIEEVKARRIIERVKQLTEEKTLIGENLRN